MLNKKLFPTKPKKATGSTDTGGQTPSLFPKTPTPVPARVAEAGKSEGTKLFGRNDKALAMQKNRNASLLPPIPSMRQPVPSVPQSETAGSGTKNPISLALLSSLYPNSYQNVLEEAAKKGLTAPPLPMFQTAPGNKKPGRVPAVKPTPKPKLPPESAIPEEYSAVTEIAKQLGGSFPVETYDDMKPEQQRQALLKSGLSEGDQWTLLNAAVPLDTVATIAEIEANYKTYGLTKKEAETLSAELWNVGWSKFEAKRKSGQFTYDSRGRTTFIKMMDEKETALLRSYGFDVGDSVWHNEADHTVTPPPAPGPAPVKTPSPEADAPARTPHAGPTPRPAGIPDPLDAYDWYGSVDDAARAWAYENRGLGKDLERCAFLYRRVDENGREYYTFGKTREGMKGIPALGIQDNVVAPFISNYLFERLPESTRSAFIHTHPDVPDGWTSDVASEPDKFLLKLRGVDKVFIIPYEYVRKPQPKNNDEETGCYRIGSYYEKDNEQMEFYGDRP